MSASDDDLRREPRFSSDLPVDLDGGSGRTQNISDTGVYFETDVRHQLGALVNFTVEFTLGGQRQKLLCEGKVVRIDEANDRIGVAARLLTPLFDAAVDDVVA